MGSNPGRIVLFLLAATLFNIIVSAVVFVSLIVLFHYTLGGILSQETVPILFLVFFFVAFGVSFFLYGRIVSRLSKSKEWSRYLPQKKGRG